ncbi:cytosolic beta-glucosidase-like isoform X2 [Glandiceps talaboti]
MMLITMNWLKTPTTSLALTVVFSILVFGPLIAMAADSDPEVFGGFVYKEFEVPTRDRILYDNFPDNFTWAVATSSYQIEGAWNEDGKGQSIWDTFSHQEGRVYGDHNGDVACDSYHKIEEDVALLKNLSVTHYRFSLSWPRILPDGTTARVNQAGIDYYQRLIDALVEANIQPMVTLYHWDLPQALEDMGGWENDIVAVYFNDFADLCFKTFGDRVKMWITLNEPLISSKMGYELGIHAPGVQHQGSSIYRVGHNMLKAHSKAWHTYNSKYRNTQKGFVGITLVIFWGEPASDDEEDIDAADRYMQFHAGWFAHPIFIGDYPEVMKKQILTKSRSQCLTSSRLPTFNEEEIRLIRGTADFLGVNYYTAEKIRNRESASLPAGYLEDQDISISLDDSWPKCDVPWMRPVPWGLREVLNWVKDQYGNPPIYITENGIAEKDTGEMVLEDTWRSKYLTAHINEVLKARKVDGVNVQGYTAWSLMDNFEWADGYKMRFGLHFVDFNDPNRSRKPKSSAALFRDIVQNNGFKKPAKL